MTDRIPERDETVETGRKPRRTYCAALGVVCALVLGVYAWSAKSGWLELAGLNAGNAYYNLLVQGFCERQLALKREVPPKLAQLSNPFDPVAENSYRTPEGCPLHDLSYYREKLYLYFGVTPALVLFWPWYELTRHFLLHRDAVAIFCAVGFLAGTGLLAAMWRRYFAEVSVAVVVTCVLALGLAGGAPLLLARADVYEVAISCGYALTMLALVGIWGVLHDSRRKELWLAAASLAFGLAVGARSSLLFGAVILVVPVVWGRQKSEGGRQSSSFFIPPSSVTVWLAAIGPIALIGLGLMLYNFLRFGDPLEFGQRYQLNVETKRTMEQFGPGYLWFNFRVGFLAPAQWSVHFPFVRDIAVPPMPKGSSIEHPFGVVTNLPLVWLALLAPLAWCGRLGEARSALRCLGAMLVLLFGIYALTLCLHNSMNARYEVEYAMPLVWMAVLGIFGLERALAGRPVWRRATRWGWGLLLVFSMAFNLFAKFQLYSGTHVDLGLYVLKQGRVDEAIAHFQKALKIQPENADAHYRLGTALLQLCKAPEAVEELKQALRLKPDDADARYNLGTALFQLGKVPEAVGQLEEVLRFKPGDAEAHNNLGIVLARQGRVPEAIGHYERALQIKPNNADAHYNLGTALFQLGKVPEAIGHYERALRLKPESVEAYNNLANALAEQGKLEEAIQYYTAALRLRHDNPEPHYNLGLALARQGRRAEAMQHLSEALRLRPDYAEARRQLDALAAQPAK